MPKTPKAIKADKPTRKKRAVPKKSAPATAKTRSSKPRTAAKRTVAARKPRVITLPRVKEVLAPAKALPPESLQHVLMAVEAARSKLAKNILLLDLRSLADFTDYFFICSGTNPRQVQAICDEIDHKMKQAGLRITHTEGYNHAEWVLLDYVDFVAHIFTEQAREYYDLERLWRTADRVPLSED